MVWGHKESTSSTWCVGLKHHNTITMSIAYNGLGEIKIYFIVIMWDTKYDIL
jgi:hypothetical protein